MLDMVSCIFYMVSFIIDITSNGAVMPFREKTAWVSLIVTAAIWGNYFWKIWPDLSDGSLGMSAVDSFISAVVELVILQIIIAIVLAIFSGKAADAPMDEREQLIDLKGMRAGFYILNTTLIVVSALWVVGASALTMANGVLAAMVLAELLRAGWVIAGYRRGV